jgi:hypothetical protein
MKVVQLILRLITHLHLKNGFGFTYNHENNHFYNCKEEEAKLNWNPSDFVEQDLRDVRDMMEEMEESETSPDLEAPQELPAEEPMQQDALPLAAMETTTSSEDVDRMEVDNEVAAQLTNPVPQPSA